MMPRKFAPQRTQRQLFQLRTVGQHTVLNPIQVRAQFSKSRFHDFDISILQACKRRGGTLQLQTGNDVIVQLLPRPNRPAARSEEMPPIEPESQATWVHRLIREIL